jgi:hypothetical protein
MNKIIGSFGFIVIVAAFVLAQNVEFSSFFSIKLVSEAEAVVGRPATPVSYAGVARRSPVGVNRVGNRGGPVNRVGRR